jgi:hypothetical protein
MAAMLQKMQYRLQATPRSVAMPAAMACLRFVANLAAQVALAVPVLARPGRGLADRVAIDHVALAVESWVSAQAGRGD